MGNTLKKCSCANPESSAQQRRSTQQQTRTPPSQTQLPQTQTVPMRKPSESEQHSDEVAEDFDEDEIDPQNQQQQESIITENKDKYFTNEQLAYYEGLYKDDGWKAGDVLGMGSFGKVVLGLNLSDGTLMAVKQVHVSPHLPQQNKDRIKTIQIEIEVLKQLKHRNIVRYIGTTQTNDTLNIFLEYVAGGSISTLLQKYGSFNENLIKIYTKQILEGLEYLHAHKVVHRDIKGANILIDNNGVCKLADFGSAKQMAVMQEAEKFNSLKGTANWMAPEVIKQSGSGRFSDIWSLGCTVLEMATGKAPWSQKFDNPITAMFHIAKHKKPPPVPKNISPLIRDFLDKCFSIVPENRPNVYELMRHPFLQGAPSTQMYEKQIIARPQNAGATGETGKQQQQNGLYISGGSSFSQKVPGSAQQAQLQSPGTAQVQYKLRRQATAGIGPDGHYYAPAGNSSSSVINISVNNLSVTSNVSMQFKKMEEYFKRQQVGQNVKMVPSAVMQQQQQHQQQYQQQQQQQQNANQGSQSSLSLHDTFTYQPGTPPPVQQYRQNNSKMVLPQQMPNDIPRFSLEIKQQMADQKTPIELKQSSSGRRNPGLLRSSTIPVQRPVYQKELIIFDEESEEQKPCDENDGDNISESEMREGPQDNPLISIGQFQLKESKPINNRRLFGMHENGGGSFGIPAQLPESGAPTEEATAAQNLNPSIKEHIQPNNNPTESDEERILHQKKQVLLRTGDLQSVVLQGTVNIVKNDSNKNTLKVDQQDGAQLQVNSNHQRFVKLVNQDEEDETNNYGKEGFQIRVNNNQGLPILPADAQEDQQQSVLYNGSAPPALPSPRQSVVFNMKSIRRVDSEWMDDQRSDQGLSQISANVPRNFSVSPKAQRLQQQTKNSPTLPKPKSAVVWRTPAATAQSNVQQHSEIVAPKLHQSTAKENNFAINNINNNNNNCDSVEHSLQMILQSSSVYNSKNKVDPPSIHESIFPFQKPDLIMLPGIIEANAPQL